MSLRTDVAKMLSNAQVQCASCKNGAYLLNNIKEIEKRMNEPLRVAVVGIMKAGKSTLMNALLKEKLLFTGKRTTTYTVTWFKYADEPRLEIVFRDGTSQKADIDELENWTTWQAVDDNSEIKSVQYVIIYYPNGILKQIELIDTPGLNSIGKADSDNTTRAIIGQAEEDTIKQVSLADAVLYTFVRTAGSVDRDFLEKFQGNAYTLKTTPINGLGILTQSDVLWNIFENSGKSAIDIGKTVTDELIQNPTINKLVYRILPTACIIEEGIVGIDDSDWDLIYKMSSIADDDLVELLYDVNSFIYKDNSQTVRREQDDFPDRYREYLGSSVQREKLVKSLSQYGLFEFIKYARQGKTREEIVELGYELSGIKSVLEMLNNHFGNKAYLIKVDTAFKYLKRELDMVMRSTTEQNLRNVCENILENIDEIETTSLGLKELGVLQDYYNGKVFFENDEEERDFKQITGEYGKSCEARLGITEPITTRELQVIAYKKIQYWNARSAAFDITEKNRKVAKVLARSYSHLYHHLTELNEF